jgi:tetratricopeptide (TPR) repeat protein
MTDPLSSVPPPAEARSAAGEDARIEHLLVTGLDHYFAGEFDTAINLWTRVLFLDRQHDRARAYIERARSAQAEGQRQTEALVHQGLAAFDRGDVDDARLLISDAMARGASHDLALGVLGRIDRLDVGPTRIAVAARRGSVVRTDRSGRNDQSGRPVGVVKRAWFWTVNVGIVAGLVLATWWVWTTNSWQNLWPSPAAGVRIAAIPDTAGHLPVPTVAEAYLSRGRALFESGRLRDALTEFDRVPAGNPLRGEADAMRARIQRELLALALAETATGAPRPSQEPREQ